MHRIVCSTFLALVPGLHVLAQAPSPGEPGALVRLYDVGRTMTRIYPPVDGEPANVCRIVPVIDLASTRGEFAPMQDRFVTEVIATLMIEESGEYQFRLTCDDGARFFLNERAVIDLDGLRSGESATVSGGLVVGPQRIRILHFDNTGDALLKLEWKRPGAEGDFEPIPTDRLRVSPTESRMTMSGPRRVAFQLQRGRPGDGQPLAGLHPACDLFLIRGSALYEPRVSGLAFHPRGDLVVTGWDFRNEVYALSGWESDDRGDMRLRPLAFGLEDVMGCAVVGEDLFVLQRQELTQLICDPGSLGTTKEYRAVCANWPISGNYHEFATGPVLKDGSLHIALTLALDEAGRTLNPQVAGRGTVIKVLDNGEFEYVASGLRSPTGLGVGPDGELFATDTFGDGVPAGKLVHVKPGRFFGVKTSPPGPFQDKTPSPPAVYLPYAEVAMTPMQPSLIPTGPYKGQMLIGDISYGGLARAALEKVGDEYQGCVFQFSQGFESGVARLAWTQDGALFLGGWSIPGWGQPGKNHAGFHKLRFNDKSAFEMHTVRAKSNGLLVEFTQPLPAGFGGDPRFYFAQQWRYAWSSEAGAHKTDEQPLDVKSASVSADRKQVFLEIPGLKADRVVYLRLLGGFRSESGADLWTAETWYTMNTLPTEAGVVALPAPSLPAINALSPEETAAGWKLLFDGKTTAGWRGFKKDAMPEGWAVEDGCLTRVGGGGDIVTAGEYDNFELSLEWKVAPGGNSGIFYRVADGDGLDAVWHTGPEMQVLDNDLHNDGQNPLTSAGACYALYACPRDLTLPVGRFNQARIVVQGARVEHWLNGVKVCGFELGSDAWNKLIEGSKFKTLPRFGKEPKGRIALQDHGDKVWFRNIKIRPLPATP